MQFQKSSELLIVACLCIFLQSATISRAESCLKSFKNVKDHLAAMQTCKDKLNLKDGDISKNFVEELPKNGYNDKCFLKCILIEVKFMTPDGAFDMKAVEDDFRKNGPADKVDALLALFQSCADTTAKDATLSKDPCKYAAATKVCFMKNDTLC